jgi:hypothetical protein
MKQTLRGSVTRNHRFEHILTIPNTAYRIELCSDGN